MMQHIATSKTEIAAFNQHGGNAVDPLGIDIGSEGSASAENFRHLLKEHQPHYKQPVQPKQPVVQKERQVTETRDSAAQEKPDVAKAEQSEATATSEPVKRSDNTQEPAHAEKSSSAEESATPDKTELAKDSRDEKGKSDSSKPQDLNEAEAKQTEAEEQDVTALSAEEDKATIVPEGSGEAEVETTLVTDLLSILQKVSNDPSLNKDNAVADLQPELAALVQEETQESGLEVDALEALKLELQALLGQLQDPDSDLQKAQDVLVQLQTLLQSDDQQALQNALQDLGLDENLTAVLPELEPLGVALLQQLAADEPANIKISTEDLATVNADLVEAEQGASQNLPALEVILTLPEETQDKILTKLAEHIVQQDVAESPKLDSADLVDSITAAESISSQLAEKQQTVLAALQNGVKEIKDQIQQGHKPGIDLQTLVDSALSKLATEGVNIELNQQQLAQSLQQFTQQFELAQTLRQAVDTPAPVIPNTERPGFAQQQPAQTEAAKATLQQNAQFERPVNITRPEGHQQLSDKVRFMVSSQQLQADIRLDPPELGSMKVRVNLSGESASVNFVVQSQQAREVLEQNTPRLKELLEEQGIELGQSFVQQDGGDQAQNEQGEFASGGFAGDEDQDDVTVTEQRVVNGRLGGIDYFV